MTMLPLPSVQADSDPGWGLACGLARGESTRSAGSPLPGTRVGVVVRPSGGRCSGPLPLPVQAAELPARRSLLCCLLRAPLPQDRPDRPDTTQTHQPTDGRGWLARRVCRLVLGWRRFFPSSAGGSGGLFGWVSCCSSFARRRRTADERSADTAKKENTTRKRGHKDEHTIARRIWLAGGVQPPRRVESWRRKRPQSFQKNQSH